MQLYWFAGIAVKLQTGKGVDRMVCLGRAVMKSTKPNVAKKARCGSLHA